MQPSEDDVRAPPTWTSLGLEVVTDVVGWLVALAILQGIGTATIARIAHHSLVAEVLFLLVWFFLVTIVVRVVFLYARRRNRAVRRTA